MKTVKSVLQVLFIGLLALAGSAGLGLAQEPEPSEGDAQPRGQASVAATVGSKFSYQGVLKEGGIPVTGSRDMTFRVYSDDTCSTQVGIPIVKSGVAVTDGLFSVELDVTHGHIDGRGLWLEVEIGGTSIGCQEMLPVPYALSLRPGAIIRGDESSVKLTSRTGLVAPYTESGVTGRAEGTTANTDYYGVYGFGSDAGVYGESDTGTGVYADGQTYGVYAESSGLWSTAVYASGNPTAIYADGNVWQSNTTSGLVKAGVNAYCDSTGSTINRSFANITMGPGITIANGASEGRCTIDFPFDINARFWVVTAEHDQPRGASCAVRESDSSKLDCIRWTAGTGAAIGGPIMVLIY
jgi:hypothetical protein